MIGSNKFAVLFVLLLFLCSVAYTGDLIFWGYGDNEDLAKHRAEDELFSSLVNKDYSSGGSSERIADTRLGEYESIANTSYNGVYSVTLPSELRDLLVYGPFIETDESEKYFGAGKISITVKDNLNTVSSIKKILRSYMNEIHGYDFDGNSNADYICEVYDWFLIGSKLLEKMRHDRQDLFNNSGLSGPVSLEMIEEYNSPAPKLRDYAERRIKPLWNDYTKKKNKKVKDRIDKLTKEQQDKYEAKQRRLAFIRNQAVLLGLDFGVSPGPRLSYDNFFDYNGACFYLTPRIDLLIYNHALVGFRPEFSFWVSDGTRVVKCCFYGEVGAGMHFLGGKLFASINVLLGAEDGRFAPIVSLESMYEVAKNVHIDVSLGLKCSYDMITSPILKIGAAYEFKYGK